MRARQRVGAVAAFVGHVLVAPVRDGQLKPSQWHPMLRILGALTLVAVLAAVAHVIAAEEMRRAGDVVSVGPDIYLPAAAMPMVSAGLFLAMTLLQTAALHVAVPLRVVALAALAATTFGSLSQTTERGLVLWVPLGALVALVLFHLVRAGRRFASFEVIVVAVLVFCCTQAGMLDSDAAFQFGFETRGLVLTAQMQFVWTLAVPALVAAGTALTQVAVTSGEAVGAVASRRLGASALQAAIGVLVLWRCWVGITDFAGATRDRWLPELFGSLLVLALTVCIAAPFVLRARRVPDRERAEPGALADSFGGVSYLLAALATLWLVFPNTLHGVRSLLVNLGRDVPEWIWTVTGITNHPLVPSVSRLVAGGLCLLLAWRWARRGQWLGAVLVAGFIGPQVIFLVLTLRPETPLGFSSEALGLWLLLALLVTVAVVAASRDSSPRRLGALLSAAAILTLHDFRHALENPLAALIGFSALASVLFGITWRVLTDGEFTHGDSRAMPQGTRVLLYLANIAFVTTVVMFSALTRDATGFFDLSTWEELGDEVFAYPLYFTAVLVALFIAAFDPRRGDTTTQSPAMTSSVSSSSDSSTRV
ncbi:hypothetical protein GCM10028820_33650 [Tessaracoccus terricola]